MIEVINYTEQGFSVSDAESVEKVIKPLLEKQEKVILDFSGVKTFTALFFNKLLGKYLIQLGPEKYDDLVQVKNLSAFGESAYQHSLQSANDYYKRTEEQRREYDEIVQDISDL